MICVPCVGGGGIPPNEKRNSKDIFDLCFFVLTNYFVGSLESCTPFMCLPSVTTVVASLWPSWRRPSSQLQLSTAAGSSGPGLVGLSASIKFDLTRDPKSFPAKINSTYVYKVQTYTKLKSLSQRIITILRANLSMFF